MKEIRAMNLAELAAFVCSHLRSNGISVVLSGGGCVAVYTEGRYVSYDLDFVENLSSGRRRLKKVLAEIGFVEKGRYFTHPDTEYGPTRVVANCLFRAIDSILTRRPGFAPI